MLKAGMSCPLRRASNKSELKLSRADINGGGWVAVVVVLDDGADEVVVDDDEGGNDFPLSSLRLCPRTRPLWCDEADALATATATAAAAVAAARTFCSQFYQHFTSSFCANILLAKHYCD